MAMPPDHRIEIVLMSDQDNPVHLWVQSTADASKHVELSKQRSLRAIGIGLLLLVIALYLFPGAVVILLLIGLMIGFPLSLVGMAGYFRKR
ncbi:hypothetical protein [Methylocystis parvus]|uniref:Uncharacterized protein n=1 Tax=Methylocystis parvus TaxID=134 RepID=A0A6B8MBP8_9HYPH|nr:hypothetical protein [Methylocystis parvus]QGM99192.1 hypothetical protein F7D14_18015 [Methylocystis parvus]WBK00429.1 hypothetical protein MMG94_01515 [Methylocystis parvus OBBP]